MRNYHWIIAPCGNTVLNLLVLSEQAASVWSCISDGPYRSYEWNSAGIEFKHRTNKEITGLSDRTSLVVQALKTFGRVNVSPETIKILSDKLTETDKETMLKETAKSADWIYDTIRKIAGSIRIQ